MKEQITENQNVGGFKQSENLDPMKSQLKMAINNLIWMHSPEDITIGLADSISNTILEMILSGKNK